MTKIAFVVLICLHGAAIWIPWQKTGEMSGGVRFGCLNAEVCFAGSNQAVLPPDAPVFKSGGYDGQFYYYAAYRLSGQSTVLDSEPFRLARIGYPLLVSPFTAAGPSAVVAAMALIPFLAHLLAAAVLSRGKLLFAANPFSVLSACLYLADGLAFSLAAMVIALAFQGQPDTHLRRILVFVLTALSCLCKETALALPAAALVLFVFHRRYRRPVLVYCILGALPLLYWWNVVGFSLADAAMRGTEGSGLLAYLAAPDAFLSGRGILFLFFCTLFAVWLVSLAREGITGFSLMAGAALAAGAAASREYWDNFANIARLFFPAVPGLLLRQSQAGWTVFFLIFSVLFLLKESRASYPL